MAEMPQSYAESTYSIGSPSKFDITVFPNASMMNVQQKDMEKKKILAPNAQLRSLENVPQQMVVKEDEDYDIVINTVQSMTPQINNYTNPSRRDRILRWIATALSIIASLLLVQSNIFKIIFVQNTVYSHHNHVKYLIFDGKHIQND